jgi:hypothetical protein
MKQNKQHQTLILAVIYPVSGAAAAAAEQCNANICNAMQGV